jgi:hypothetical protein
MNDELLRASLELPLALASGRELRKREASAEFPLSAEAELRELRSH